MPIPEDIAPYARRRVLLQRGHARDWWRYESENEPGFTWDGVTYRGVTHTIRLSLPDGEGTFVRILLAVEVEGYVLATAEQWGPDAVEEIRYRPGL